MALALATLASGTVLIFEETDDSPTRNFHVHSEPLFGNLTNGAKRPFIDFEGDSQVTVCGAHSRQFCAGWTPFRGSCWPPTSRASRASRWAR